MKTPNPTDLKLDYRWFLKTGFRGCVLLAVIVLAIVCLGAAQRMGWIQTGAASGTAPAEGSQPVHTCPMHPQIRQNGPGRCPICGMELVAAVADPTEIDQFAVTIEPAARRLADITTASVTLEEIERSIETIGMIDFDESRLATISTYVDGRIEDMLADYTGVPVERDGHLAVVWSPDLYEAQTVFLSGVQRLEEAKESTRARTELIENRTQMVKSFRQRLLELGMKEAQVKDLEATRIAKSRLTLYSDISGTVIEKRAVEGQYVKAGDVVYRVADLSTVWLKLKLFPDDAAYVRLGQQVRAEVDSLPGQVYTGRVAFIDPVVDPKTRSVAVRVEIVNTDGQLRPGDFASAEIKVPVKTGGEVYDAALAGKWISPMHPQIVRDGPGKCTVCGMDLVPASSLGYSDTPIDAPLALVIPRDAILAAGHNSVVYVQTEPGRFEIRPVRLGPLVGDKAVVLSGLKQGEEVATSGNFLIDSQMQLAGKPSVMDPSRAVARKEPRGPLQLELKGVVKVSAEIQSHLERLYDAYFRLHKSLSEDTPVNRQDAESIQALAAELLAFEQVPSELHELLQSIIEHSAHIHHMDLKMARAAFKPISHSILRLAARTSGLEGKPLIHFYCPMVKGGGGDWLQATSTLANPYYGSEMLRCGNKVREISRTTVDETPARSHKK